MHRFKGRARIARAFLVLIQFQFSKNAALQRLAEASRTL
jgi:hypothetical protein